MLKWIFCLSGALFLFLNSNSFANEANDVNFAIICTPVANLREKPQHKAELCDQEIMGYTVTLLNKHENWYQVKMSDGYIGWMTEGSFFQVDKDKLKEWQGCKKVRIVKVFAIVYSQPNVSSKPVTNVTMNALLQKVESVFGGWIKVQTPDGRTGFLKNQDCVEAKEIKLSNDELKKSIIETSRLMMGAPYLWGGRSSTACDCSGFSNTVFRANGIIIGRDSRAQAVQGIEVKYNDDFSNVLPGDLIFFGQERVSHVAISMGGKEFIHQSSGVHITSFDPNNPNYEESYRKKIKAIRRFF
jgi:cell wall-associated NlpC family hydrolase